MARLLVVDDEKSICSTIEAAIKAMGHEVEAADSGEMALNMMRRQTPDILLTDLRMDGMSGLDLLGKTREYFPSVTVAIMTAFGTIDTAVSAMKNGAYDYLVKPFTPEQLEHLVERIEEFRRLRDENSKLRYQVDALSEPSAIVTKNARMQKVLDTAKKVAVTDSTILITGESGTGKTLLAKLIHDASPRAKDSVRGGQLRDALREPARERAVRARARLVSPARSRTRWDASRWPTPARSFWTKSAKSPRVADQVAARFCRSASSSASATRDDPRRRRALSRRRTRISSARSRKVVSARISTSAST